jgi:hypothetical protein
MFSRDGLLLVLLLGSNVSEESTASFCSLEECNSRSCATMETADASGKLVPVYCTRLCCIPNNRNLRIHLCENLRRHNIL